MFFLLFLVFTSAAVAQPPDDLRALVRLDLEAVEVVERAFAALATGRVVMPPILSMEIAEAHGEVDVKTAYIPGFDGFAIKVSPGPHRITLVNREHKITETFSVDVKAGSPTKVVKDLTSRMK